ncbi:hypothetical protein ACSL103130_02575 [Actinomyces slackii]|uniref:Lantibiotic protection ABC transporter permease subunit, MutE/EpiE family n=1 Tax=Actinomyces slackii TaxID=52774 RepID=A0A448KE84_9ACTO|nr:hypothetical protein [Actinomyces slackii]VEG75264.1 lantibiotic protection ABC transporter permease subunit, MutE/EpiE family [Actinomyces slackii]
MTTATTATRIMGTPGARVGLGGLLGAELLRSRRTFTWGVIGATLAFTVHTLILAHATISRGVVEDVAWNGNALAWMHFYPAGFAIPLGLLVGVMAQWREDRWRQGGTAWRAVSPRRVLAARMGILSVSALACQLALVAPVVIHALITGGGWGPWPRYLAFILLMWIQVTGASAWGMVAYRLMGVVAVGAAPVLGLVWSVAGLGSAERPDWWMLPWAWSARPVLPLLGVHGNSVILETGSPVWDYPVLPGALASVGLAALGAMACIALGDRPLRSSVGWPDALPGRGSAAQARRANGPASARHWEAGQTDAGGAGPARVSRSALRGLGPALPWRLWLALAGVEFLILVVVRSAYSPEAALGLLELVGLPISATVVGICLWGSVQASWRSLIVRREPAVLLGSLMVHGGMLMVTVGVGSWLVAQAGQPLTPTEAEAAAISGSLYGLMVMPAVAFMMVAVSLAVAMCARPVASIVLNAILLLDGLVIGGNDVLARTSLWVAGPWAWMRVAEAFPGTWLAITGLSAVIGCGAMAAAIARARHVAVREGA